MIILVGGQTRMPKVQEVVTNFFGSEPRQVTSIPMRRLPAARQFRAACWVVMSRTYCCSM